MVRLKGCARVPANDDDDDDDDIGLLPVTKAADATEASWRAAFHCKNDDDDDAVVDEAEDGGIIGVEVVGVFRIVAAVKDVKV